jgi:ethanolamine ammonia-lyase small subunit
MTPAHRASPAGEIGLRRFTHARVALGRAGGSLPTGALLDFRLAHARARDAVQHALDPVRLAAELARATDLPVESLRSRADSLAEFLARPDLGRRLDDASALRLSALRTDPPADVVLVVSEGLSALAAERHAAAVLGELVPGLRADGWRPGPVCYVRRARVAVQDPVGAALGATHAVILLGERPGLATPDSLGAYLVRHPRPGNTDAARNCVSNIHADGLRPADAAARVRWLLNESRRRGIGGVELKDESAAPRAVGDAAS